MIIGAALLIQQAIQGRTAPTQPLPSAIPEKILAPVSTVPPAVTAQPVASSAAVSEMLPHSNAKVHASGTITFDSASINVTEAQSLIAIQIRRLHSTRGSVSVAWVIEGGTARPAVDYAALDQGVVRLVEGQAVRSIFIPLLKRGANATSGRPGTLVVALRQVAGGPVLGPVRRATVTISPLGRLEAH